MPRPFSRASGGGKPTRILSNVIGVPGVIVAHGVGSRPGDCDGDDFTDGLEAGLSVVGDGSLDVPLALAAGADVLLGAAELELGAAGHQ
jgi:hypothetical protein